MQQYEKAWEEETGRTATLYAIIQMISAECIDVKKYIGNKKIAIYGIGMMGNALFRLLKRFDIDVKYAIDKRGGTVWNGLKVYKPEDNLQIVDYIVITAESYYLDMKMAIESKGIPYMSIGEFVEEIINIPINY